MLNTFIVKAEKFIITEPQKMSNVVCATGKGSDQPAHMRSLTRALLVARIIFYDCY